MGNTEPRPIASLTSALIKRGKQAFDSVTARAPDPAPPMPVPEAAAPELAPTAPDPAPTVPEPAPTAFEVIAAPAPAPVTGEPAAEADPITEIAAIAAARAPVAPSVGLADAAASGAEALTDDDFDLDLEMASITPEGITSAAARREARRPRRDRRYRFLEETPRELQLAPVRARAATAMATAAQPLPDATPASGDLPPARPTGADREPTENEIAEQIAAIRREYATRMGAHGGSGHTTVRAADPHPPSSRPGNSLRDAFLFLGIFAAGVAVILYFLNAPL